MTSSTLTPAEPIQKTVVTSQLIAAGGGCTACTMLSSTAELAFHDRDGHRHHDDREPQPECIRCSPPVGTAAPRSQHRRAVTPPADGALRERPR